ncbi:MAG: EamA family transporter [Halobacteriaceae archaeon]
MTLGYLPYALLALAAYSFVPPLVRVASEDVPSDVLAFVTNGVLVAAAGAMVLAGGHTGELGEALTGPRAPYVYGAGVCLAVGILAYYHSLHLGPVSVVTPVFGMFLVTSSLIGVVFLNETLSVRHGLGVAFAVLAVYLTTTA